MNSGPGRLPRGGRPQRAAGRLPVVQAPRAPNSLQAWGWRDLSPHRRPLCLLHTRSPRAPLAPSSLLSSPHAPLAPSSLLSSSNCPSDPVITPELPSCPSGPLITPELPSRLSDALITPAAELDRSLGV